MKGDYEGLVKKAEEKLEKAAVTTVGETYAFTGIAYAILALAAAVKEIRDRQYS